MNNVEKNMRSMATTPELVQTKIRTIIMKQDFTKHTFNSRQFTNSKITIVREMSSRFRYTKQMSF